MPQAAADRWARRIQRIVEGYREKAGMSQPIHPHLFRHQMLTYLTTKGLSDAQIQLIPDTKAEEPGGLPTPVTRIGR